MSMNLGFGAALIGMISWLLAGTIGVGGALAAAERTAPSGEPDTTTCGAVVDDGSPF